MKKVLKSALAALLCLVLLWFAIPHSKQEQQTASVATDVVTNTVEQSSNRTNRMKLRVFTQFVESPKSHR